MADQEIPKFDDTEPLFEETTDVVDEAIDQPKASGWESARAGLASGGSFGLGTRLGSAIGASADKLTGSDQSLSELYNEYLDYNKKREAKAAQDNPMTYGGAMLAGGLASPLNAIAGGAQLPKNASMLAKMAHSAEAGAKLGTIAGAAQSEDLTNIPKTLEKAGEGMVFGGGIGAAAPPVIAGIKGAAGVTGAGLKTVFGPVGERFGQGKTAGLSGAPNLAGEPGQLVATQERAQFAEQFVDDLNNILNSNAKNKKELVSAALEKSQLAPKEAVDAITQKYLDVNPDSLNGDRTRKELAQLQEMIIEAIEGPKKMETVRLYTNPERPVPSKSPQMEMDNRSMTPLDDTVPIEMSEPMDMTEPQIAQGKVNNEAPAFGQDKSPELPPSSKKTNIPADFAGYEPVHKATIEAGDNEARAAFNHKVHEKLADEKALGRNYSDSPVEIEEVAIPGSNKVRLIAKRAKAVEQSDDFAEQAAELQRRAAEEARLQKLLDAQQQEKMRFQQMQEKDMAKPEYYDIQQEVRAGGRNIQDPAELYKLQKNLQEQSKFSEGRGFASQEMNQMAGQASKDISQLIKMTVPETVPVDQRLNAFNNVAERLGIDTDKLRMPGGEGAKARADAMQKVLSMINPESASNKNILDQSKTDYIQSELQKVAPELSETFGNEMGKHSEAAGLIKEFSKPYEPTGINWLFNVPRKLATKGAYSAGHAIGSEIKKTEPMIEQSKQLFQSYTPDALKRAAAGAAQSTNATVQKMGQVLSKLANSDERTRNATLFVLQQQNGYRELMSPYFEQAEPGTPQAQDRQK